MDKTDYNRNGKQLLNDTTVYRLLDTDPAARLQTSFNKNLKKLEDMQRITKEERWRVRVDAYNIEHFCGLPKVHNTGTPLRPIFSSPAALAYSLAREL